jgi:hypothetical protein
MQKTFPSLFQSESDTFPFSLHAGFLSEPLIAMWEEVAKIMRM